MPRTKGKAAPGLTCSSHDCANNKHCFKPKKRNGELLGNGECRGCGEELVDFERVHRHDLSDLPYTVNSLRLEFIRDEFWTREFTERAVHYAQKKGMAMLCEQVSHKVVVNIGDAADAFDGRRVPVAQDKLANPYQYAFHATATCCRRCTEYWHGIPPDRPLTPTEVNYLSELVTHYLRTRLRDLPSDPQMVLHL